MKAWPGYNVKGFSNKQNDPFDSWWANFQFAS